MKNLVAIPFLFLLNLTAHASASSSATSEYSISCENAPNLRVSRSLKFQVGSTLLGNLEQADCRTVDGRFVVNANSVCLTGRSAVLVLDAKGQTGFLYSSKLGKLSAAYCH